MGRIILIDFKKRAESRDVHKQVNQQVQKMDVWIAKYPNDGTPPTEAECTELEDQKIQELLQEFDDYANENLTRVMDEVKDRRQVLARYLQVRKGSLFHKFSAAVDALQDQAAKTLSQCVETLDQSIADLKKDLPISKKALEEDIAKIKANCEAYVEATFPEGVKGLDSYDDVLPDGIPSYAQFLEKIEEKKVECEEANKKAIEPAIEKVKASSSNMFKEVINKAIENAIVEIKADLSDDVLPYLTEEQMSELRATLIQSAEEYGKSRLSE